MNQPHSSKIIISAFGLSLLDEVSFSRSLRQDETLNTLFEFNNTNHGESCSAVVVDIDSNDGKRLWYILNSTSTPIRIAYTEQAESVDSTDLVLPKPLTLSALHNVMQKIQSQLAPELTIEWPTITPEDDASSTLNTAHQDTVQTTATERPSTTVSSNDKPLPSEQTPDYASNGMGYQLKRWPDFKQFTYSPKHVKAAVLISNNSRDVKSLSQLSGLSLGETNRFIHRCLELGYLDTKTGASIVAGAHAAHNPNNGLFGKIRSRLGI